MIKIFDTSLLSAYRLYVIIMDDIRAYTYNYNYSHDNKHNPGVLLHLKLWDAVWRKPRTKGHFISIWYLQ